jgi:hypothetical protein
VLKRGLIASFLRGEFLFSKYSHFIFISVFIIQLC